MMEEFLFAQTHKMSYMAILGVFFIGFWVRGLLDKWVNK